MAIEEWWRRVSEFLCETVFLASNINTITTILPLNNCCSASAGLVLRKPCSACGPVTHSKVVGPHKRPERSMHTLHAGPERSGATHSKVVCASHLHAGLARSRGYGCVTRRLHDKCWSVGGWRARCCTGTGTSTAAVRVVRRWMCCGRAVSVDATGTGAGADAPLAAESRGLLYWADARWSSYHTNAPPTVHSVPSGMLVAVALRRQTLGY